MTASQQRAQRRVNPSGVSLVGVSVSPCADGVVVGDTVIRDDFVGGRADDLDAEAAYYRHRAIQEERVLGLAITWTCCEAWPLTGRRWRSGYGPRSQLIDVLIGT